MVPVKPATRDQTFDLGFEVIGDSEWGNLHIQLNAEITNKHHGFEVWSGYSYQFNFGDLTITPSLGLTYKSDNWTNYFYGVRENEAILATDGTSYIRAPYQAGSSLNHYYKIIMNYPISAQLKLVAILENEQLDKIISDSPIVDKTNMATQFIGLFYEF